jgi:hypothetical protein
MIAAGMTGDYLDYLSPSQQSGSWQMWHLQGAHNLREKGIEREKEEQGEKGGREKEC